MTRAALVLALVALLAAPAAATVHSVCSSGCDFSTIASAMADAGTASGDTIQIQAGTYTESVVMPAKALTFLGEGGPTWIPSGTGSSSGGPALWAQVCPSVWVEGINFQAASPTSNQGAIVSANPIDVTILSCTFTDLRMAFADNGSHAADIVFSDNTVTTSQSLAFFSGTVGVYCFGSSTALLERNTFDVTPLTGTASWIRVVGVRGASNVTLRDTVFRGDPWDTSGGARFFFQTDDNNVGLLVERCHFDGLDNPLQFGTGGANEFDTNVTVRDNVLVNFGDCGIGFRKNVADGPDATHRNVLIQGNRVYGDPTHTDAGLEVIGAFGVTIDSNVVTDCLIAGIQTTCLRRLQITHNDIFRCDNNIVMTSTSSPAYKNQAAAVVGNLMVGGGGDGSFKIDNWTGTSASPQDSLLHIDGNVYVGVAIVAKWVDTADVTTVCNTLEEWRTELQTHPGTAADPRVSGFAASSVVLPAGSSLGLLRRWGKIGPIPPRWLGVPGAWR